MRKQVSGFRCRVSAKTMLMICILFLALSLNYSFSISAYADNAGKKGTLSIPKRPGSVKQSAGDGALPPAAREIQKKYEGIKDIKGTFVQKSYIKDLEDTQEYSGTFSIKKPSQMMWEYAAPRDEKVIINDKETLIYKKSQNQVIKTKFSKETYSQVPIALLGGLENIGNDFHVTVPSGNALQLVPRRKIGFIKTVVLETMPGDMPIKMFTIFDTYGNIIMIEMKNVQINQGLEDSVFTLITPPDAEVYDMSQ
jgi:outer membrane lipoprotein carrier protein